MGSSSQSEIKSAGSQPFGNSNGQYGAEGHCGIISVPLALVFCACLTTLGTKYIGGYHQLFSMLQSQVNVSTVTDLGTQNLESGHLHNLQIYLQSASHTVHLSI